MQMKRLFNRKGFDPDAHLALRGEIATLGAQLKRATGEEAKRLMAALSAKKKELATATPDVIGVNVKTTGATAAQHFSDALIRQGQKEGWLERKGDQIVIHSHAESIPDPEQPDVRTLTHEGDLVYKVVREPGYYCCYCGAEIPDANLPAEDYRTTGLQHVAEEHAADDATVRAAIASAVGARAKWQAVAAVGKSLGLDERGQLDLANNPAGYRQDQFVAGVLVDGAGKEAASTIKAVKAHAKGGK